MSDEEDVSTPSLPLPGMELAARLSHTIAMDAAATTLQVTDVAVGSTTGDSVSLQIAVTVTQTGGVAEHWDIEMPEASAALHDADYFVLITKVHLDEWWHTKETDPMTATWGTRRR
jgi:hypothetical protein